MAEFLELLIEEFHKVWCAWPLRGVKTTEVDPHFCQIMTIPIDQHPRDLVYNDHGVRRGTCMVGGTAKAGSSRRDVRSGSLQRLGVAVWEANMKTS